MTPSTPADGETAVRTRRAPSGPFGPIDLRPAILPAPHETEVTEVRVPLGRRVVVLGDLLLLAEPTPSSRALASDLARTLDDWQGPGVVVVCGNLFAVAGPEPSRRPEGVRAALAAHQELADAIRGFTSRPDCRLVVIPGWRDPEVGEDPEVGNLLAELGARVLPAVDLLLQTAAGTRRVLVRPGRPSAPPTGSAGGGPVEPRPWLTGVGRLEDPTVSGRFVTSRLLYRRLGRLFLWVALLPAVVAMLLRLPVVFSALTRVLGRSPGPHHALAQAHAANWADRTLFTVGATVVVLLVLALVVAVASRLAWTALGGGDLPPPWPYLKRRKVTLLTEPDPSHGLLIGRRSALDEARAAIEGGASGLIAGGRLQAELTQLDPGFFGSPGGTAELVREHPGRGGLPPVFLHHRQSSWIELETGADLHVRLLLADAELPTSTFLERLATSDHVLKGHKPAADLHPALVASWPRGAIWPPPPDVAADRTRVRRVRRLAAAAIFVAGLVDLLEAVTPPLRGRLHLVEQFLPLGVAQAAGALVALAGVGLMMLARGVLRGQRRSWLVSVVLLGVTIGLHVAHDAAVGGVLLSAAVLGLLLIERNRFGAATDTGSVRSALLTLVVGAAAAVGASSLAIELSGAFKHRTLPPWPEVLGATAERLIGLRTVPFPDNIDDWIYPSLLTVGIALAVIVVALLTRPVVDHRLSAGASAPRRRAAEVRARDLVRRHGAGTLDYFALRDDKQWFFHRDSLVAYAVYGGVCLVSPDPIGPRNERAHVWDAFRRYADRHGWAVGVMAAAEEWLPIYRDSGMRYLYIGDEAVVDVTTFTLQGGRMKGLRQAVGRVRRNGYTVRIVDPTELDEQSAAQLMELIGRNRRGDQERGFSMMLGRIFDHRDAGLLMTVVSGPDGAPAAVCQFVPSPAIGGYSLDLMRRDPGEHPNGLLDFALVSTIDHLRESGDRGLSLNFAAMRSLLDGESGDKLTQRVERWALRRLSGVLQIESLWRFNAKYEPSWLPRYVVWDSAEQFVPTVVQILRAESLTEIPVVGRLLATSPRGAPAA